MLRPGAAVLLPLLVLFGLKYGIVASLLAPLTEDPRYRQILPAGAGRFEADWFEAVAARPDVAFVIPSTRSIAATLRVHRPASRVGRILDLELVPSAPGDPALNGDLAPEGYHGIVLSLAAAERLQASPGERLEGTLTRTRGGLRR